MSSWVPNGWKVTSYKRIFGDGVPRGFQLGGGIKILECLKITYFASIHLKTMRKPRLTNKFSGVACPEAPKGGVSARGGYQNFRVSENCMFCFHSPQNPRKTTSYKEKFGGGVSRGF